MTLNDDLITVVGAEFQVTKAGDNFYPLPAGAQGDREASPAKNLIAIDGDATAIKAQYPGIVSRAVLVLYGSDIISHMNVEGTSSCGRG